MNTLTKFMSSPVDTTASLTRSAMLVDLSVSQWTGRKRNRAVSDEVVASKNAKAKNAATVYNALLGDCKELDQVQKFVAMTRKRHMELTLPWADSGTRLLPTKMWQTYMEFIEAARDEFDRLVKNFLAVYDVQVTKAAFDLGDMFSRDNYPPVQDIACKFDLRTTFCPVPDAGDFRIDIDHEIKQDIAKQYEGALAARMQQAKQDVWDRLHSHLTRMSERLAVDESGKPAVFKDSMMEHAEELVDLMKNLNPTNDPKIEQARLALLDAIKGKSVAVLRSNMNARQETKDKVERILKEFDFGL